MTVHYKYSPSKLSRILKCHGSAEAKDDREPGEAAEYGTRLHGLAADALMLGAPADVSDREDKRMVQTYLDYVASWQEQMAPCQTIVEETLVSVRVTDFGGTADCILVNHDTIHVIDFKTGRVAVDPYDNTQIMAYLTLALEKFPHATKFYGSIVQPIVSSKPVAVEYTRSQLLDFQLELFQALGSNKMEAGSHCEYCPLLQTCETAYAYTMECAAFEPVEDLSNERIAHILQASVVISALESHAKKQMFARLMRGETIPGWRLGVSLSNRKYRDEAALVKDLKALKLRKRDYVTESILSPAQLELHSKEVKAIVDRHTFREEKGPAVVPETSKSPIYDPTAIFNEVNDDDSSEK